MSSITFLKFSLSLTAFCIGISSLSYAQKASETSHVINGKSKIIHYTKSDFRTEAQFWSMVEDKDGIIYFGTNYGVVIFDGKNWSHVTLPNSSSVKTVAKGQNNRIYVGGFNEFGTIEKDEFGGYYYQSLMSLLTPEERNIEEVWQIIQYNDLMILRCFESLIIVSDSRAAVLPTQNRFGYITNVFDKIYVIDQNGINTLDPVNLKYELFIPAKAYNYESIISILPVTYGSRLITFSKQGNSHLIDLKTRSMRFDRYHLASDPSDQIFSAIATQDQKFYLGTINNHLMIYDLLDKTHPKFRKDLQDKTVLNLYEARNGDIWTLLNRGVDCIEKSYPGSIVFDGASVYDAVIHDNQFYVATNQGVYRAKMKTEGNYLSRGDFEIIKGLEAQAWGIAVHEDKVLVGHDKGVFVIESDGNYRIDDIIGSWKIIAVKGRPGVYLSCGYDGLYVLNYQNGTFTLKNKIENFDISTRDILQSDEQGGFWVCHGYKGVFKISINEDFTQVVSREHFTDKNGLPSQYNINVTSYDNQTVFLSRFGFYTYDEKSNRFVPQADLNESFSENLNVSKLSQQGNRSWFVQDDVLGYFNQETPQILQKSLFSSLNGTFITSMEYIEPLNDQKVLIGNNEGLYVFNITNPDMSEEIPTLIHKISYKDDNDSLIYVNLSAQNGSIVLPYDISSLTFHYISPLLSPRNGVKFSYHLANFDKHWSPWEDASTREYSYLKHGKYNFKVKAMSLLNQTSKEASYQIEILPIWYQTKLAYWMMALLALIAVLITISLVRKKLKATVEEEAKLRKVLELELQHVKLEREKELIMKDNEKLEEDIVSKSKEIANYTLLLVKKHDLLAEINQELNEIKKYAKLDKTKNSIRSIAKRISLNLQDEEHLKVFDTNFERVHHEFFTELKAKFPDLQQKELRLCGLVKMNMTNKEIASILNISVRGIETARYRLRKRLSIDQDVNIVEFLEKLSSSTHFEKFNEDDQDATEWEEA